MLAGGDLANNMSRFLNGFVGGIDSVTQAERVQVTGCSFGRSRDDVVAARPQYRSDKRLNGDFWLVAWLWASRRD